MKTLNYTQIRPPGALFDNAAVRLIVHWMHPLRLKAFRGLAAAVTLLVVAAGCETEGETVPMRTGGPLPPAAAEPQPVLLAQADVTPTKIDKPAAAADLSTNVTPALTTAEATAKAMAAVGARKAQSATPANTNLPPAIAQTQTQPPVQGQAIEITTNYVPNPNQQVVVQQAPPQTVVVEQQPTVVYSEPETVSYFYDSLSPYGSWFYASD